jgi:hypothetical protein
MLNFIGLFFKNEIYKKTFFNILDVAGQNYNQFNFKCFNTKLYLCLNGKNEGQGIKIFVHDEKY